MLLTDPNANHCRGVDEVVIRTSQHRRILQRHNSPNDRSLALYYYEEILQRNFLVSIDRATRWVFMKIYADPSEVAA